jgi:hypothetical protein
MVEWYVKAVVEHLLKVITSCQRDWDVRLPVFLLANRPSTHDSTGIDRLVFRREPYLPCGLLFRAPSFREQHTVDHTAELMDQLHNIHYYTRQHLKLVSDRMKAHYDHLANSVGFQEDGQVWPNMD